MRSPRLFASCLALTLAGTAFASTNAVLTPVSQNRAVSGTASAGDSVDFDNDSDSASAPDFGPFVAGAGASATAGAGNGSGGGSQSSQILPTSIVVSGSAFAVGEGWDFESFGSGSGSSNGTITFTVDCTVDFTFSGTLGAFDSGGAFVGLSGPSGPVFDIGAPHDDFASFDESGVLVPGEYTLTTNASGSASGGGGFPGYASSEYSVALQLAGPTVPLAPPLTRVGLLLLLASAGVIALGRLRRPSIA